MNKGDAIFSGGVAALRWTLSILGGFWVEWMLGFMRGKGVSKQTGLGRGVAADRGVLMSWDVMWVTDLMGMVAWVFYCCRDFGLCGFEGKGDSDVVARASPTGSPLSPASNRASSPLESQGNPGLAAILLHLLVPPRPRNLKSKALQVHPLAEYRLKPPPSISSQRSPV